MGKIKHEVVNVKFREGKGERYEIVPGSFNETAGLVSIETTSDRVVIFTKEGVRSIHITRVYED